MTYTEFEKAVDSLERRREAVEKFCVYFAAVVVLLFIACVACCIVSGNQFSFYVKPLRTVSIFFILATVSKWVLRKVWGRKIERLEAALDS